MIGIAGLGSGGSWGGGEVYVPGLTSRWQVDSTLGGPVVKQRAGRGCNQGLLVKHHRLDGLTPTEVMPQQLFLYETGGKDNPLTEPGVYCCRDFTNPYLPMADGVTADSNATAAAAVATAAALGAGGGTSQTQAAPTSILLCTVCFLGGGGWGVSSGHFLHSCENSSILVANVPRLQIPCFLVNQEWLGSVGWYLL